jgi:hypothetical protein
MTLSAATHLPALLLDLMSDADLAAAKRQVDGELERRAQLNAHHWYAADISWSRDNPGQMMAWTPTKCDCTAPWEHGRTL